MGEADGSSYGVTNKDLPETGTQYVQTENSSKCKPAEPPEVPSEMKEPRVADNEHMATTVGAPCTQSTQCTRRRWGQVQRESPPQHRQQSKRVINAGQAVNGHNGWWGWGLQRFEPGT